MFRDGKIKPEQVERLNRAYSFALRRLSLVDRNDPVCEIVARKVIEIDAAGIRDPQGDRQRGRQSTRHTLRIRGRSIQPPDPRPVAGAEQRFRSHHLRTRSDRRTDNRTFGVFAPSEYQEYFWRFQSVGRTSGNAAAGGLVVPWAGIKANRRLRTS